jgi:hypothetical protein
MYPVTIIRGLCWIGDVELSACHSQVLEVLFPDKQKLLRSIEVAIKEDRRKLTTRTTAGRPRQEERSGTTTART